MIVHTADNPYHEVPLPHTLEEPVLTQSEKEICDRFVLEYRIDYNYLNAAIRVGFEGDIAVRQSKRLKYHSYVQRQIAAALIAKPDDPKSFNETNEQRIINSLFKEANDRGVGSSHGARVSALSRLSVVCGMEKPIQSNVKHEGTQEVVIKTEFDYNRLGDDELEMVRKLLKNQIDGNQST